MAETLTSRAMQAHNIRVQRTFSPRSELHASKRLALFCAVVLVFFLSILATATTVVAEETTPLNAQSMEASVVITNTVHFEEDGPRYRVDEATGTLSWYPRDNWVQKSNALSWEPTARLRNGNIVFEWSHPLPVEHFTVSANVVTAAAVVPVRQRVAFPLENVPYDAQEYLRPGEISDMTPQIQSLAQELAAGKTDAYDVVFTLADWTTRNVNYSLASLGQPAVQSSSQVLQSRYGKCDELTSLFISLNRALGIPARFVGGYAYTNSDRFDAPWGGHGWAEVWLPGNGWIPFDVTYGEYGYLDAGHIALKYAPDAQETSIDFTARGADFELRTEPLNITITPRTLTPQARPAITVDLETPHTVVGFGSAVLILAHIKNTRDYYVSTRLDLAKTTNTDLLSSTYDNILLSPFESRTVPFLVKLDNNLESGYRYEFPFRLTSRLGADARIIINAREDAPRYDPSSYAQELAPFQRTLLKSAPFNVTCNASNAAYATKPIVHTCMVRGVIPPALHVCEGKSCRPISTDNGAFTLETIDAQAGVYTRVYHAVSGRDDASFYITSRSVDPPAIVVSLAAPEHATPDDTVTAVLLVNSTGAKPLNVSAQLRVHHTTTEQPLVNFEGTTAINFALPARLLRPGQNTLNATITYTDELGTAYTRDTIARVDLVDTNLLDHIMFQAEDVWWRIVEIFA